MGKFFSLYDPIGREEEYRHKYEDNVDDERDGTQRKRKGRSRSVGNVNVIEPKETRRRKS